MAYEKLQLKNTMIGNRILLTRVVKDNGKYAICSDNSKDMTDEAIRAVCMHMDDAAGDKGGLEIACTAGTLTWVRAEKKEV